MKTDAQYVAIQGLAGIEPVSGLLDVVGVGIAVYVVGDFVDAWQGMEDAQVGFHMAEHVVAQDVDVFHALVFHQIGKAFFLHTGHVEDVGLGDHLFVKVGVFLKSDALLLAIEFVLVGHGQLLRRNEVEGGIEMPHSCEERVDGSAVFQVAHQTDVQILERALRFVDRVKV